MKNEQPFKEIHHHIAPMLIQEVREHFKMLEIDTIRRSNSPFSSNVFYSSEVVVKDGTICFCIDYRKLINVLEKMLSPFPA